MLSGVGSLVSMKPVSSSRIIKRYTDLPALFYLLHQRALTLLDPRTWDDTNDAYYLSKYKEKREIRTLLALCMTEARETYHHWRIFGNGAAGVCIDFYRDDLTQKLKQVDGVKIQNLDYRKVRVNGRQVAPPSLDDLPYVKRYGFAAEAEVRIIFESSRQDLSYLDIPIDLSSIQKITLSPWLNERLKSTIVQVIRSVSGCENLKVSRSTLVSNAEWKRLGDKATEDNQPDISS